MSRISMTARALNILLAPTLFGRRNPDRAWSKIVAEAESAAGSRFEDDFAADLGVPFRHIAEVPQLTALGYAAMNAEFKSRLINRLRVQRLRAEHPEIGDEPIDRPVFIVGLPRTATTLTHKILANSEGHRGPLTWEMHNLDLETSPEIRDQRIRDIDKQLAMLPRLIPDFPAMHPLSALQPEESLVILPHTRYYEVRAPIPGYAAWLEQRDLTDDYAYLKAALQVLQHGRPRARWILKTPFDLFHLPVIHKVFPDATIVWTHRDPVTVMASACSLAEALYSLAVRRVDRHEVGATILSLLSASIEQGRADRVQLPPSSVIDVPYHQLNFNPHRFVPELYDRIGAKWTDEDAATLDSVLARPQTDRKHEYVLGDYGLTLNDVEKAFGDYTQMVTAMNS